MSALHIVVAILCSYVLLPPPIFRLFGRGFSPTVGCTPCYVSDTLVRCVSPLLHLVPYSISVTVAGRTSGPLAFTFDASISITSVTLNGSASALSTVGGQSITIVGACTTGCLQLRLSGVFFWHACTRRLFGSCAGSSGNSGDYMR